MNPVLNTIKSRRSTRKFKPEQVEREAIEKIVEAGIYAPSGHNKQSWHFTVVQNAELLAAMNRDSKEAAKVHPDAIIQKMANNESLDIFYGAPTVIVISGENHGMTTRDDCAAATQNMLLAAESMDIGGCWNGIIGMLFNSEKVDTYKNKLQIPTDYTPLYAIAIGHKAARATQAPARREGTVHYV